MNLNVCHLSCVSCASTIVVDDVHLLFEYFIVFHRPTQHRLNEQRCIFSIRMRRRMLQSILHKKGSAAIPNDVQVQLKLHSAWNDDNFKVNTEHFRQLDGNEKDAKTMESFVFVGSATILCTRARVHNLFIQINFVSLIYRFNVSIECCTRTA